MKTPKEIGQEWDRRIARLDPQYINYEELFKRFCYWRGCCLRAAAKSLKHEQYIANGQDSFCTLGFMVVT